MRRVTGYTKNTIQASEHGLGLIMLLRAEQLTADGSPANSSSSAMADHAKANLFAPCGSCWDPKRERVRRNTVVSARGKGMRK